MPARPSIADLVAAGLRDLALDDQPREDPLTVLHESLFAQQRALIDDTAHPTRAACCSRRAGKTQGIIRGMLERCISTPRSVCVYFAMTLKSARRIVWDVPGGIPDLIADLDIAHLLKPQAPNETQLRVDFLNGSVLWVSGIDTIADAKTWKGIPYDIAVCDEAQDWVDEILEYMVNTALSPALMDRNGQLLVTGTPGPFLGGLFYEITAGLRPGWGLHSWTCFENPHIPDAKKFVAADLARRKLSLDDPVVQREYFARWVRDVSTLLFQYSPGRNDFAALPGASEWRYVLGMDVGVRDLATFVLCAFRQYDPCVYIVEVHGERATEQTAPVTRFAEVIRGFQQKYGREMRMVMDAGGLGLGYQLELRNRFSLNVETAKKSEKAVAIRLMNDQFRLGMLKVGPGCGALTDQWQKLQIDPKTQIEKPTQACDFADAALYGWRDCYAYLAQPEPDNSEAGRQRALIDRVLAGKMRGNGNRDLEQERREMGYQRSYEGD